MTTEKAFEEMINQRGIHHVLEINESSVTNFRYKLNKGMGIKYETKVELLKKAGYDLVQEPKWKRP